MTRILLIFSAALLFVLHQDIWNWSRIEPLAFGFLPVGLWYHALYCMAVAGLMWGLVRWAWPVELERQAEEDSPPGRGEESR